MKYKIKPNSNKNEYNEVTNDVIANDGFCPCMNVKNQDTKCICKEFKEKDSEGLCRCGRFIKILNN